MPTLINQREDALIEFSSGVRIKDSQISTLGRHWSYRRIAEFLGVSYIELHEGVAIARGDDPDSIDIAKGTE